MIGKILGGRYEILKKVGGGGMALVYKAKCKLLNRYVAIKILRDEFTADEEFINKFRRESQAAASLSHANIVNIYDVGVDGDIYYIVMEYIDGKTLKEVIKEKGKLTPEETINYSIQIAEALKHAHQNHIVHRDIKPHNIMVTRDERVKVTDFGIARAATSSTLNTSTSVMGSAHYFSPEQARGKYTDEKSDIYSLGIVMYEMITGKVPFEGDSPISIALKHIREEIIPPSQIDSSIPKNLENVIMKCTKKNQSERYQSSNELLRDLKKIKYSGGKEEILNDTNIYDSPTRVIPIVKDENVTTMESNKKVRTNNKNNKKKKNGGKKVVFFGILFAFLLASTMAFGFLKFKDLFISKEIKVPDLVGMPKDEAEEKIQQMELKLEVKNEVYSSEFKEGDIVFQHVESGEIVKKGYPIGVDISKGNEIVTVPNLVNKDSLEVDDILQEVGLSEGSTEFEYSNTVPKNKVINQNPEPYSDISKGSRVDIVISQGSEIKSTPMPKLIGLTLGKAKKVLVNNKMEIGIIKEEPNDEFDRGIVFWQSYEPGTEIEGNTAVDLYVSSGNEEDIDDEIQKDVEIDDKNDKEITKPLTLTLPQDKDQIEVKVIRIQDEVSKKVYDKVHNPKEEGDIVINLTGKSGKAKFEIYFDGKHFNNVDF